ncbi:MAG: acyl-CoA thioesterase [Solirubrobacterales bacterium]
MTSQHRLRRRVNFYETDLAGIVHFSCFFRYMEEAEHALWREAGLTIAWAGEETGFPRLAVSCDFHSPLRFDDEFEVWVRVARITRRTIHYTFAMTRGETKIATGSATVACVSKRPGEPMKAIDLPAEVVAGFEVAS